LRNNDIGSSIPLRDRFFGIRRTGGDGKPRKTKTSKDGSAFGQCPESVVFATLDGTINLVEEEAAKGERGIP